MSHENQWDSSLTFILAMIGAAVGLGNIWRYSYVLYSNGGGAFFIPYLFAIFVMGIPFLILEYGIGFSFKDSFSNIVKSINPKFEYISWILVILVFIVVIYYVVILGWDLVYLISSFTFNWGTNTANYFVQGVGGSSNLSNMNSFLIPTTIAVLFMWIFVWYISHKGVTEGIGKVSKVFMPLLFIFMGLIIVYAFTLPGAGIGINALIHPDWNMLLNVQVWLAAFSQIIFSLSMGQAIALTYASYLPKNSKLIDNVLIVVATNCLFEVLTAFGVFSILGYMSHTSGTPITQLVTEGTSLIFVVFPKIFNVMGVFGRIIAPLLFLAILFAGITSALGFFEPLVNTTLHKFGWSRKKTVTVLSIVGCAFSLMFTTGISSYMVQIVDTFVNEFGILILIAIQCIIFTWFYDIDSVLPVLNENGRLKIGKTWKFIIKYFLPLAIAVMWVIGIYQIILNMHSFEFMVDAVIVVLVLIFAILFTKIKTNLGKSE
ncbi:sodium-dependent transporter [Methanobrevibacter sp.]|uniref:sodium-dependent transporter n=1 Tax=Methanobrevibacter sp. TaxID=66852 RepID=UPI00388FAD48